MVTDTDKIYTAQTVYVLNVDGDLIAGFSKQDGNLVLDPTVVLEV